MLSSQQQVVIDALSRLRWMTSLEVAEVLKLARPPAVLLQSLFQRGLIRYVGGPGVKVGKGKWELTKSGNTLVTRSA